MRAGTMEYWTVPTLLERIVQLSCSAGIRHKGCRRPVCRRLRLCMPPRDRQNPAFRRCPFDTHQAWTGRVGAMEKIAERMIKVAEKAHAARGMPSPFAPKPIADHLDLSKPLDVAALIGPLLQPGEGSSGRPR